MYRNSIYHKHLKKDALLLIILWLEIVLTIPAFGQNRSRARDLEIPFDGTPGLFNAITDVAGVEVGHTTIIAGDGKLEVGKGPVRTGVTAILPRGKKYEPVFAGWYSLNGNGEMTGTIWIEESGFLEGPIMITNTHSVGVVHEAVIKWLVSKQVAEDISWSLPVVAETWDGFLNDINGFHVKKQHVFEALSNTAVDQVAEGNVGGGTGMVCHGFKGGIGTASRKLDIKNDGFTVGVLVQANYGRRNSFMVAGVPVGKEITDLMPTRGSSEEHDDRDGSIIVVVATDAPLLPHQLKRLARRVPLGIARVGGLSTNSSGDIFIAFSTANFEAANRTKIVNIQMLPNDQMDPLFAATIQATEEAIINALVAAETMTGVDGNTVYALPKDRLIKILKKYNRVVR